MADLSLIDGMRLVFVGDSIFNQKKWTNYLAAYFHLRNPTLHLSIFTIARGGMAVASYLDSGNVQYEEYSKKIKALDPVDYVFLEFGHNGGYTKAEHKAYMQDLVDNYIVGYNGAIPVFCGCNPTATSTGSTIIGQFDDANQEIATVGGWQCNKLWQNTSAVWTNSSNWTAIGGADSTHPGDGGNVAMFWKTIEGFGWSTDVSQAVINGAVPSVTGNTNCTISSLVSNAYGGIDFNRLDNRLPWAIDEVGRANGVLLYPSFANAQNYTLTVTGLTEGTYDIYIGGVLVTSQTHTALSSGWNMSDLTSGPIFDQCQDVLNRIRDLHDVDRTTLLANPTPREGIELYKSNVDNQYENNGLREAALKASVSTALASIDTYDALIHTAKQPVTRLFSLRRRGFGVQTEPSRKRNTQRFKLTSSGGVF